MKKLLPVLIGFPLLFGSAGEGWAITPCDKGFQKIFACRLAIISDTFVDVKNTQLLRKHQADFNRLVRLRTRNDLSMFKLNQVGYFTFYDKYKWNDDDVLKNKLRSIKVGSVIKVRGYFDMESDFTNVFTILNVVDFGN